MTHGSDSDETGPDPREARFAFRHGDFLLADDEDWIVLVSDLLQMGDATRKARREGPGIELYVELVSTTHDASGLLRRWGPYPSPTSASVDPLAREICALAQSSAREIAGSLPRDRIFFELRLRLGTGLLRSYALQAGRS